MPTPSESSRAAVQLEVLRLVREGYAVPSQIIEPVARILDAQLAQARAEERAKLVDLDVVFDGPPSHESGRFIEVEVGGKSVSIGEWTDRGDGYWQLRFKVRP